MSAPTNADYGAPLTSIVLALEDCVLRLGAVCLSDASADLMHATTSISNAIDAIENHMGLNDDDPSSIDGSSA